jgi:hypothetical protein
VVLGSDPVKQSITLTASDKEPLSIRVRQLPASSPFSLSSVSCPDLTSGKDCNVQVAQGKGITLDVTYKPSCIGTQADSIQYDTDVPSSGTIALGGKAMLKSLSYVQLPGRQTLAGGSGVTPNASIDLGLNATPGYCLGQSVVTVAPHILFGQFKRPDDSQTVQYDERVAACASGTVGCLGTLKTGTVAGTIELSTLFTDAKGADVGYPTDTTLQLIVPPVRPALIDVKKGSVSQSSFQLNVTGYSTPRKNTQACFKFVPAAGSQVDTSGLNTCYGGDISVWYERTPSIATGSQFDTAFTFSFAGDATAIGTVDAWLKNDLGDSDHACLDFKSGTSKSGPCQ